MKKFLLFIVILALGSRGVGQDVDTLLQQASALENGMKEGEALEKYKEILRIQPLQVVAMFKCSELCGSIGNREKEEAKKIDFFNASRTYAETALKIDSSNSGANAAMAIAMGRMALIKKGKEKIDFVKDIKTYSEKALAIDPNNAKALFVLGKWHYEVSNLNFVERAAIKVLYGGMPKASYDSAITYYERVKTISPWVLLNYYELAKAYVANHQSDKAIENLERMLKLPYRTEDDAKHKDQARQLLATLQ